MKKIILILDGEIAKHFLNRLITSYVSHNEYLVIYSKKSLLPEIRPENFTFYKFDPTSALKLAGVIRGNISSVYIIMRNRLEVESIYKTIRLHKPELQIFMLDMWDLEEFNDKNLIQINSNTILAGRIFDHLPDVPLTSHDVGLGIGEIMEVLVPFGSSYVYRNIGSIEQVNWKIVALYRNNTLILPRPTLILSPNDVLIIIGEPRVLKNVYSAIKKELGQFPSPFGTNIYLYIDFKSQQEFMIKKAFDEAIFLHQKLKNKKLIIRILNPSNPELMQIIKESEAKDIVVIIDYKDSNATTVLRDDVRFYNIGLIIIPNCSFIKKANRELLFNLNIPVLKIGIKTLIDIKESLVILSDTVGGEKISPVVFDISSQLNLKIKLSNIDPEGDSKDKLIEHYKTLSKIFSKDIHVISMQKNPLKEAKSMDNFLQFMPFTKNIATRRFLSIFSTNIEQLFFKLSEYNQLFIPIAL